jgi:hypothetical protein
MQSTAVVVTDPDFYFADQSAILLIGCDEYIDTIMDNIRRMDAPVTVYATSEKTTLEWITSAYYQCELVIINCAYNSFYTGFFIDKPNVYYYNNIESYNRFNLNEAADPVDVLITWINKWHIEHQEKNKDLKSKSAITI